MHTTDFPSISEVAESLVIHTTGWAPESGSEEDQFLDVRLQVTKDGRWAIHTGNSRFDTDHTGFWGATSIEATDAAHGDVRHMRVYATDLIEEAMTDASMAGELEEDEDNPAESLRA
jgi:hypothetical protein